MYNCNLCFCIIAFCICDECFLYNCVYVLNVENVILYCGFSHTGNLVRHLFSSFVSSLPVTFLNTTVGIILHAYTQSPQTALRLGARGLIGNINVGVYPGTSRRHPGVLSPHLPTQRDRAVLPLERPQIRRYRGLAADAER